MEALVGMLRGNLTVARCAAGALANLARGGRHNEAVVAAGKPIGALLRLLRTRGESAEAIAAREGAAMALCNLAPSCGAEIIDGGALPLLIAMLDADAAAERAMAAQALMELSRGGAPAVAAALLPALPSLVRGVRAPPPYNTWLHRGSAGALAHVAAGGGAGAAAVHAVGAVRPLLALLGAAGAADAHQNAMCALRGIADISGERGCARMPVLRAVRRVRAHAHAHTPTHALPQASMRPRLSRRGRCARCMSCWCSAPAARRLS